MRDGRWRISVTVPDWGHDHLSSDAVVAYVDGELAPGPHTRATEHLAQCPECAAQVVAQGQARAALRTADCPSLPSSLLSSLRAIPQDTDLPGPPAGLSMTADGELVTVLRPERDDARRGRRDVQLTEQAPVGTPLAEAPPAGLDGPVPHHGRRPPAHRGLRLGTGVAVSGLALGALAFGLPSASGGPSPVPTAADRGVLGGAPAGVVDARLRVTPAATPAQRADLLDRVQRLPASFRGLP
ncbi:anti-sigma factor family protein [Pseudonocardia nigra]|uniref:anti-sigma factor family protein n=1 Tax=Pseudonocardia nigra TaxID=1921578 RepID=UPI001C5D32AE|nr:zf-HC2 domain-containing protein [Pseudonocardia nigra]